MTNGIQIDRRVLAIHRNNFHSNKLTGPLLRWSELDHDAQAFLTQEFIINSRDVSGIDLQRVYVETLHYWGVMCPHPIVHRLYGGFRLSDSALPFETDPWFTCMLCEARVINRA